MAFPIMAAASLLSGGLSMLKGGRQRREAREMAANNARPDMPIPTAILESQKLAKNMAQEGLPSEQYTKGLKNIDRSATNALRGATDRRGGLMSVGQVQATRNDALGNLDVADANARQRNQMNLINQTNQLGRYQQNAWDWNKRQKFLETAASVRALMGAGNANFNQGLDRGIAGGAQIGAWGLDKLMGKGGEGSYQPQSGGMVSGQPRTYGEQGGYSQFQNDFDNEGQLDSRMANFMATRGRL